MTNPAALKLRLSEQVGALPRMPPPPLANTHVGFEGSTLREAEYPGENVLVTQSSEEEEVQQRTP